ncbi:YhcH/YjgK/YiaL family protein [Clostridium disporicum]|uniref:YhcH/YjgK/YiaL family protein n=1 Tax=Clostridium disporicum TaxID=84024 RepID=UPI0006C6C880|nr:YhcH/YjgK/YiaL family protein [Clostridium disporicum]CUO83826.1 uncharacterized protein%2C YhcH/YjgK/YiaL family [Clostridium disporicum]
MIFGNIKDKERYNFIDERILECFKYAIENNLNKFSTGTHEINGDDVFVNVVSYKTTNKADRFWEAHRKYIDVHLMLDGTEKIALNHIDNLEQKEYEEEGDFLSLNGEESAVVTLEKGDFLICYPEDAHMTAIKVDESKDIKKAIFKVKII